MPRLVHLYIVSVATGFAVAGVFVAILLWFDVAGLGHLVRGSSVGWVAVAMLVFFNGIVFAGVQFGIAVAGMAERHDPPPRGGPPVPVLVAAGANRGRRPG